ncbi:MAG: hypothetical protein ABIT38_08075 [Gemmatimonadaceae bacterium]
MLLFQLLLPPQGSRLTLESPTDSSYSSPALRQLMTRAAQLNLSIPSSLRSYRALVESEVAVVLRSAEEKEGALQLEQVESSAKWMRPDDFEQRVVGYRSRAATASLSALSYFRRPWLVPMLYGNRLRVALSHDKAEVGVSTQTVTAIHPLANDREQFYRYSGGDTVEILRVEGRTIPIVRVQVEPKTSLSGRVLVFRGEVYIDAVRFQVVRMRGELSRPSRHTSIGSRLARITLQRVLYVELENGEFLGAFWLPTYQRIEAQGRSSLAGELRPVFRVVSRFRHYEINDETVNTARTVSENVDGTNEHSERLSRAGRDTIDGFAGWTKEIGAETIVARASDFDDVAPDEWRTRGAARLDWHADHLADVARFNRVEGLFSGASTTWRFRDRAPGASLGARGGWAWSEHVARGALFARRRSPAWQVDALAERRLANTNDFRPAIDFESSLMAALVTADDYDYLDRRHLQLGVTHAVGGWNRLVLRAESGPGSDRSVASHVRFGLIHVDSAFRANRPIDPGSYWRTAMSATLNPNVSGEFLEPGIGAGLTYERGDGKLRWQRMDGHVVGRHSWRAFTYAARLDLAAAFGSPVPLQQIIEFGENEGLPGYLYKEFGGDRAALLRGNVAYEIPLWRTPVHAWRGVVLPSLSPGVALGVQSGWSSASPATLLQLATFGFRRDSLTGLPLVDPVTGGPVLATRTTGGARSTVGMTLRLFGGAFGIGLARSLDRRQPWRLTLAVGQGL